MQYYYKSDTERCKYYHLKSENGEWEGKESYVRYLNEANLYKKERDQLFNYGPLKMVNYDEGIHRLATDINFWSAVIKHSENLECDENYYYDYKTSEYSLKPKAINDKFPGLSLFDFSQQPGIQVLTRLDTPINKILKIEAPSPTLAKKMIRRTHIDLIPEINFRTVDSRNTARNEPPSEDSAK